MVLAKAWYLTKRPSGVPSKDDFTCKEEELPPCGDGDVIVESEFLSVDPYMRYRARQIPLDTVMVGTTVCRVTESRNRDWPVGTYLTSSTGWRTHTLIKKETLEDKSFFSGVTPMPDMKHLSKSLAIGAIGMPGNTAYFGFLEICQPKAGETVLVNAAAGAVGSLVIQIAKLKGCKVIAFAGSDEKVTYCKEIGADHAFNYKTVNIGEALANAAPEKINCYFDNVGGQFTAEALPHMADFGRVSICGAISTYNDESKDIGKVSMN
ncbi:Prostaglandin reductase 1, partial [Halocaridina rubra]